MIKDKDWNCKYYDYCKVGGMCENCTREKVCKVCGKQGEFYKGRAVCKVCYLSEQRELWHEYKHLRTTPRKKYARLRDTKGTPEYYARLEYRRKYKAMRRLQKKNESGMIRVLEMV